MIDKRVWKPLLVLDTWETPATYYPRTQVGNFRIISHYYTRGLYHNWGLDGYPFFQAAKKLTITGLQERSQTRGRRWHTWMVDDPPHWRAMQKYAEAATGHVLVAGLGLGLIVHCLVTNPEVTEICIIERAQDVIDLMRPNLPLDSRIRIIKDDFNFYLARMRDGREIDWPSPMPSWDTVIVDLWVSHNAAEKLRLLILEVLPMHMLIRDLWPEALLVFHGFLGQSDVKIVEVNNGD